MPFKQLPKTDLCGIIHKQFRLRPHGQAVKTPPSHGGNWGSIPHGATKKTHDDFVVCFLFYIRPCISYCPASRYSCTAGRGVFLLLCKPVILARRGVVFLLLCKPCIHARRGVMFFIALQARYSCMAGRGVFLLPCKPRRVLHGKMRGCDRTTNRIFHGKLHILYWHSPLYDKPCVFFMEEHPPAQNFCAGGCFFVTTLR